MFANKVVQNLYAPFPVIRLGDITLREIKSQDAQRYFEYMSRKEMIPFLTANNRPNSLEKAKQELEYWQSLFANKRSFYWAISVQGNNDLMGTIGFNTISHVHLRGEVSYDLDPSLWGRGVTSKALEGVLAFAKDHLALVRVQATVITTNQRSIKVLEKCGFEREGILKKYEIVDGKHRDYYMYAKIN